MECAKVKVEAHEQCKCGCDVDAAQCTEQQVLNLTAFFKLGISRYSQNTNFLFIGVRPSLLQVPLQRYRGALQVSAGEDKKVLGRGKVPVLVQAGGVQGVLNGICL